MDCGPLDGMVDRRITEAPLLAEQTGVCNGVAMVRGAGASSTNADHSVGERIGFSPSEESGFSRQVIVGVSGPRGTSRRFARHAFGTEPVGSFASLTLIGVRDVDVFGAARLELIAAGHTADAAEQSPPSFRVGRDG
jgi:hypothetical protein